MTRSLINTVFSKSKLSVTVIWLLQGTMVGVHCDFLVSLFVLFMCYLFLVKDTRVLGGEGKDVVCADPKKSGVVGVGRRHSFLATQLMLMQ